MNYVKQLNAFMEKSIGQLNAKEQAAYLRLFNIANKLKWREWFEVADSQLMRELMISSRNTIKAIRETLINKGFIEVTYSGAGRLIKYNLVDLTNLESEIEEPDEPDEPTCSKNEQGCSKIEQVETGGMLKNCAGDAQKLSRGCSKIDTIINYKHKHTPPSSSLEPQHSVVAIIDPQRKTVQDGIPEVSPALKQEYENRIYNAPNPVELEKLAILEEKHSAMRVIRAIAISAKRGKRSADYIAGILNRSKAMGYTDLDNFKTDEGSEKHGREQPVKRYTGQVEGETAEEYLARLNAEYEEADRNQAYLRKIQPYTGGTGGT